MAKKIVSKKSNTKKSSSKKKITPRKTTAARPKSKPSKKKSLSPTFTLNALLAILVGGGFILFLANYIQLDDIQNVFIAEHKKYLLPFQWVVNIGLLIICVRYAFRAIKGMPFDKMDWILLGTSFVLGILLYTTVLHEGISDNGDNASYIINTKSLVERGGAFRLHEVEERPDVLASLGLPIVLSPVYALWGMDLFKMKIVVWLLGIGLFPILFFIFRQVMSTMTAALLTIVIFIHPVLFSSCSYVMTETPFMFWALLSTLAVMKFGNGSKIHIGWLALSFISMMMLYLTRAVGIGAFAAAAAYLFFNMPLKQYYQERNWKKMTQDLDFKKFLFLVGPLFLGALAYLIYGASRGGSQLLVLEHTDIWDNFWKSGTMTWWILSQIPIFDNSIRWLNFAKDVDYEALNVKWVLLNLFIIIGFLKSIWQKQFMSFLVLFVLLMLYVFNPATNSVMATTRYLMVLAPFYIYFLFLGIKSSFEWVAPIVKFDRLKSYGQVFALTSLFFILFANYSGNSFFIATTNTSTTHMPTLQTFFQAAEWCKTNLPADAVVASRKPRLFYLFSGLKGTGSTTNTENYDPARDKEKIKSFQDSGVTHLIFDRFSSSTMKNILPLIENNPNVFEMVHITGEDIGASFVVKLHYDMM